MQSNKTKSVIYIYIYMHFLAHIKRNVVKIAEARQVGHGKRNFLFFDVVTNEVIEIILEDKQALLIE